MENTCFSYDTYTYDSRQSLFLYALCVNTEARNNDPIYPERKYIQEFQAGDVLLGDYIVE
jgi:hypothetical protein